MACGRSAAFMLLLSAASLLLPSSLEAEESQGTPAARALFVEGDAAARAGKLVEAAAAFRKAVEADPDFGEAHQRLIEVTRRHEDPESRTPSVPGLEKLYAQWAKQQPTRAAYQWALGFLTHEPAKGDVYFNAAVKLDPAFTRAHLSLARNADLRGDWVAQRQHLEAAVKTKPADPQIFVRYALAHRNGEPARFKELALAVVEKFPESPAAAEALFNLANESSNPERRTYLERLRTNYPADKFGYASAAMSGYYRDLIAPADALSLARDMVKWFPTSKTWADRVVHQEAMVRVEALLADSKFAEALAAIEKTQRPAGSHGATWVLLKSQAAAGAGRSEEAYTTLVESVASLPDPRVQAALTKLANGVGKTPQQIDADIWRLRDAKAVPAAPFELPGTKDGKPVRLADYEGRVVLLAFWFPG